MNVRDWFPLGLTGLISLQSKGLSRVFSSTTVWKHQFFSSQPSLWPSSLWLVCQLVLLLSPVQLFVTPWTAARNQRHLLLGRKVMANLDSVFKSRRHHFANKGLYSQSYGFSSGHVWMWELDQKECWASKNWCFQIVVLEKTLESLLDCKIKPGNPKGNQPWIFVGRTVLKLKLQYFSYQMQRAGSLKKTLMLGKIKGKSRSGW